VDSGDFVLELDAARCGGGHPTTVTEDQVYAIWHAIHVVEAVRERERYDSLWSNPHPKLTKSRLLRMLAEGPPPTRTERPLRDSGQDWSGLLGGDPFDD
jgi:hypothetical protein